MYISPPNRYFNQFLISTKRRSTGKPTTQYVFLAKNQMSQCTRIGVFAVRMKKLWVPDTYRLHRKESDQTVRVRKLIWVDTGSTSFLRFALPRRRYWYGVQKGHNVVVLLKNIDSPPALVRSQYGHDSWSPVVLCLFCTHSTLELQTGLSYEPRHEKMCLRESPTRQDTNWPAQLQRPATILKFRIHKLEVSFGLDSEQQRRWSVCANAHADLHLFCSHMAQDTFSHGLAHMKKLLRVLFPTCFCLWKQNQRNNALLRTKPGIISNFQSLFPASNFDLSVKNGHLRDTIFAVWFLRTTCLKD